MKWNELIHREPGGVNWANPNLDVVYSEAWLALDDKSCTLIDLPEIKGRYYTVETLNGWGEVTANINERNFPKHPFGKFAFCLKDAKARAAERHTARQFAQQEVAHPDADRAWRSSRQCNRLAKEDNNEGHGQASH